MTHKFISKSKIGQVRLREHIRSKTHVPCIAHIIWIIFLQMTRTVLPTPKLLHSWMRTFNTILLEFLYHSWRINCLSAAERNSLSFRLNFINFGHSRAALHSLAPPKNVWFGLLMSRGYCSYRSRFLPLESLVFVASGGHTTYEP